MKYIFTSAAEAETAALFLTVKEMVALRNKLEEMGWKQPPSHLQCDNSTAVGYTNQTIVSKTVQGCSGSVQDLLGQW